MTSLGNQLPYPLYESRDVFISVFIMASLCSIHKDVITPENVVNKLTILSCMVAVVKLLILLYCIKNGINPSLIVHEISDATGWQLMTYDIDDSFISRIQFPIDLVSCFLIYFQTKKTIDNKSKINLFILLLLFFSALITMSRAFWFISIVMFLMSFITTSNSRNKRKYFFIISLFSILIYSLMFDSINSIIESRLNSSLNSSSDYTRLLQNQNLERSFYDAPLLGHGIGYFVPTFIRGEGVNKYAYESQLLSMFMKLGVIGFVLLVSSILYIVILTGYRNKSLLVKTRVVKMVFIGLWLFSGAVNPLLFSVPGGIVLYLAATLE